MNAREAKQAAKRHACEYVAMLIAREFDICGAGFTPEVYTALEELRSELERRGAA